MPILSMKGHKSVDYLTKNFLIDTMQLKATYISSQFGRPQKSLLRNNIPNLYSLHTSDKHIFSSFRTSYEISYFIYTMDFCNNIK